jgi:hypothetical protein
MTARLIGGGVILTLVVGSCHLRDENLKAQGADKAVRKVEANNETLRKKADSAGRKSSDPTARGLRSPYHRDN